jgi:hypothetical protein
MGRGKSFVALLIVAVGLGAYMYFVESKRNPDADTTTHAKVFTVDQTKIEEIEVQAASGEVTRLKKDGPNWQIVLPATLEADQTEAAQLLTSIATVEAGRVIEEKPASAAEYGLAPPRFSVGYRVSGDPTMHRLLVGIKTTTGSDLYVQVEGQPKVFLIGGFLEDTLNRTPFSLREKTVLKFARESADRVTIDQGGKVITLAKSGVTAWRMTAPTESRADMSTIDGVISKMSQAKMKAIETTDAAGPSAADLKKYGLDKPQAVVTIGTGSSSATLAVGGKSDDTSVYARDLSRPLVFTIESGVLDELKKKPEDFRNKDIFEARTFNAITFDITTGGQSYSWTKQKDPADATKQIWAQVKPPAKTVDQSKVDDVLSSLGNMRSESYTAKPSGTPDAVFAVRFGDASAPKDERVSFYVTKDPKNTTTSKVLAVRDGEKDASVVLTGNWDGLQTLLKGITGGK